MNELTPTSQLSTSIASLYEAPEETSTKGSTELGEDAFLRLLTTQLQHQDPTNPVQNEDFVAQLAQFSSLEQLTSLNGTLEGVYVAIAAMNNASMASLLGTSVIARGDTFSYSGEGDVSLSYSAPSDAATATLTVTDSSGQVVYTSEVGPLSSGDGSISWSGKGIDGQQAASGDYTFSITAQDAAGEPVEIEERVEGVIDEMDYSTGAPMPSINGSVVDIADIVKLTSDPSAQ